MTITPILIMAAAVLVFIIVALTVSSVLGVALGQARTLLQDKSQP